MLETLPHVQLFQSTLSVRRATKRQGATVVDRHISIHALREESDPYTSSPKYSLLFQSTLSVRRAT